MGEMADYYIDRMFDACEEYSEFDWGTPFKTHKKKKPHCKYCKKHGLHWVQLSIGWRLHEHDGTMHECVKHPSKVIKPVYDANELLKRCLKYLPDHLDDCPKLSQYNNPPCNCRNEKDKILRNIIESYLGETK